MALSPPKASSAGLRARHAAKRDTAASTLIQAIVTVCTRWIRRIAFGGAICSTEAIHEHYGTVLACFAVKDPLHLTLGVSFTVFRGEPWDRHSASQPSQEARGHIKDVALLGTGRATAESTRTHTGYRIFGAEAIPLH